MNLLLAFLLANLIAVVFAPLVIWATKRVGARQEILEYVTAHKNKQGTPTMGGLIFIIPAILVALIFADGQTSIMYVALAVFFCYALLGFLDDFIKVYTHKNLGLKPYQKIIGQVGIAVIVGVYVYLTPEIGTTLIVPWGQIDLSWGIIPLTVFTFLAMTNSANLTDGLDGLAGGTSFVMLGGITAILAVTTVNLIDNGQSLIYAQELNNLSLFGVTLLGGLLAFLVFNSYPAKIFMGDTGSLGLGGAICALMVFSRYTLYLPIICVVFLISAVSVILQVVHYKRTRQRILLMAPLHHHFEKKGVHETKIVAIYIITTIIASVVAILLI